MKFIKSQLSHTGSSGRERVGWTPGDDVDGGDVYLGFN